MYHHVNPEGNFINVTPDVFEKQIRHLKEHGYTTLHPSELLSIIKGEQPPPEKPLMITFDDGWLDNWLFAYPTLKKYGMKAVIFVITSRLHEKGRRKRSDEGNVKGLPSHKDCQQLIEAGSETEVMLSWEECREMEDSGLIDIQSHTHTHRRWDKLYPHPEERRAVLNEELTTSKEIIESKLKKPCNALCWPWGKYNEEYLEAARASGYQLIFTTEKGTNTYATEPWRIKRIVIGNIGNFTLRKKLYIFSREWLSRAYLKYFK